MTQSEKIFVTTDGTEISADWIKEFTEAFQEEMARAASEAAAASKAKAAANADAKDLHSTNSPTWQWVKQKAEIAADAFTNAFGSALGQAVAAGLVIVVVGAFRPLSDRSEVQS